MTDKPAQEYIITDAQLKKYEGLFFLDDDALDDFKKIRSRPAPSPDAEPDWLAPKIAELEHELELFNAAIPKHDTAIRIDERNKTLELTEVKLNEIKQVDDNLQYYLWLEDAESVIESLRQQEQP